MKTIFQAPACFSKKAVVTGQGSVIRQMCDVSGQQ